jgi:hypothetical protein
MASTCSSPAPPPLAAKLGEGEKGLSLATRGGGARLKLVEATLQVAANRVNCWEEKKQQARGALLEGSVKLGWDANRTFPLAAKFGEGRKAFLPSPSFAGRKGVAVLKQVEATLHVSPKRDEWLGEPSQQVRLS